MKKIINTIIATIVVVNYSLANVMDCNPPTAFINIEINNVRAQLMNGGDMFWDIFGTGNAKYEIPKNSGKHVMFTNAIWISALDAGNNLHTAGQTYRQRGLDFWPGPLNEMGETQKVSCREWDKMYSVLGEEIINAKLGKQIAYNVSRWPSAFAPFHDQNGDGIYDPSLGDYPVLDINNKNNIPGQMVFWTFNDKGGPHTAYPGGLPLGIEIRTTAYAYPSNTTAIINNSTMYKYNIINKSNNIYYDFKLGVFLDADVGNVADDYVGCDLSTNTAGAKRNLFYTYNADNNDEDGNAPGYGPSPPAVGITFLNTGKDGFNKDIKIGSFMFLTNTGVPGIDSDPEDAIELRRYLRGYWADGQNLTYGTPDGRSGSDTTLFAFPGNTDPLGRPNWVETAIPGDRRMIVSTTGGELFPGGVRTIEYAIVWARDSSATGTNLTSLEKLRVSTDTLISAYKNNFSNFSTGIEQKKKGNLVLYPNPSKESIHVKGLLVKTQAKIYNHYGQVVRSFDLEPNQKIMINELANGIYYLKIDKQVLKFMKN